MDIPSQDRVEAGTNLQIVNEWMKWGPSEKVRIAQIEPRAGGGYALPLDATDKVTARLADLASRQVSVLKPGPLKLTKRVTAALAFFGIAIPSATPGPGSADDAMTGGRGSL